MGDPRLQVVGYGTAASAALGSLLRHLKAGDPLAPVTVAVPHPWAGLSLRRSLAARPGGVVNVQFLVLARVAELIGAPSLAAAGQRPRTDTVTRAAVRTVLRDQPGAALAPVAHHPATEAAVVRLVDELSSVGAPGRARLVARGGRSADLAGLVERILAAAPGRYDRHDLVRAAAATIRAGGTGLAEVGHVVVHLPVGLSPAELELVTALAGHGAVHVVLGATGDERADAPTRRLRERLAPVLGEAVVVDTAATPVAQQVITTTDPDDEVRAALRSAVAAWEGGTPLDRIAVAHAAPDPYARLVTEQAQAAGIPIAGAGTATLAGSVAGRTLLGALALPDTDLARDALCDWMASSPLHQTDGRPVPTARWDELSRQAGLVAGGIPAWNHHLDALTERLTDRAARLARPDDEPDERLARDRRQIEALRAFVTWVDDQLAALHDLGSWSAMAAWGATFLREVLGPESQRAAWPEDQFVAAHAVDEALERLGALDQVEPTPTAATFRRALAAELDATHGRVGSVGRGLLVLPLRHAVGLDLDLLVVVGMAEGTLPGRTRDDALLPDADREVIGEGLPHRADAVVDQHHQLLAALASAPHRVLTSPRGDLRQSRARVPSRWLLDSVSALAGHPVTTRDFDDTDLPGVTRIASFAAGVTESPHHVSVDEHDLADLHRWVAAGGRADEHPLVGDRPGLGAGLEVLHARRHLGFNRFTGAVHGVELPTFRSGVALSPTALERWAACPRRYFFAQVLRVRARETPEYVDRISPASKGSLVHEVLDRFYTEVIARPGPKPSAEPWTEAERARVRAIFADVCREFEDEGLVGRRVLWALDREDIAQDLMRFLDHDDVHRRDEGAVPVATELPFGPDAPSGATLDLPGGRHVSFKGFADRVDRRADGSLVVLDYKTGGLPPAVKRIADDPRFVAGTKLQLPVYALAAATAHGTPDTPVRAAYWHISSRAGFAQAGYETSPERGAQFLQVLTHIADGIEGGVFPAVPGDPDTFRGGFSNCTHCDFDAVCGRNRLHEWERVSTAPEVLSTYLQLRESPDDAAADA